MKRVAFLLGLLSLVVAACAATHLPIKPAPDTPEPRDLDCIVRLTSEPKVVGVFYMNRNGTEYFAIQLDRNNDREPDLVLFYPRIGRSQYGPFPIIYLIDYDFDKVVDAEFIDVGGAGNCNHFVRNNTKERPAP